MYHIAIVEDADTAVAALSSHIKKYGEENNIQFQITRFADGDKFLTRYQAVFDIVFMDIEMPIYNGIEVARQFRKIDQNTILVFVTNLAQYAVNGYDVDALDYILKPVKYPAFSMKMNRIMKKVVPISDKKLIIATKSGEYSISTNSCTFIESDGHKITYHTSEQTYTAYGTIKQILKLLPEKQFFRCNSGIIVNLDYVTNFDGNTVTVYGEVLTVSRARKKDFLTALHARHIET